MKKNPSKKWIIKPASSSQGKGIFITQDVADIPPKEQMVASVYIDNPLLIDGYKFDLRVYVALTSINPLRLYVYEEGLVRFATQKYTQNSSSKQA
jgi:predicted ATP-grasp superfamily ATP-dependent carboligase